MSIGKRQIQQQGVDKMRSLLVGPPAIEQKPKLCGRCGKPVALAYRVYQKVFDTKLGEHKVVRGQFEVAHILSDNKPVFDACPYPSLLEQLQHKIEADRLNLDNSSQEAGIGPLDEKRTIHLEQATTSGAVRVACGARGRLWTTLDSQSVTCYNCRGRGPEATSQHEPLDWDFSTGQPISTTKGDSNMPTAEEIKKKIAQGKQTGTAAPKAAGASLGTAAVTKDADGVPLPKATGVKKQAVQTAEKAAKQPKTLNACGCGCQQPCKSKYLPGHDAKLHGWVKKLASGKMSLDELPEQVRDGMYPKAKQTSTKDGEKVTFSAVEPTVDESTYLESLKGLGGEATV